MQETTSVRARRTTTTAAAAARTLATAATLLAGAAIAQTAPVNRPTEPVALGRYLVQTAGCNDCHTPGYGQNNGKVPEKDWLVGDALGWKGPWGTTYATNLRTMLNGMTEAQWLQKARTMEPRPPMPWFNVRAMSDTDLKAMYAYVKSLGPAGQPAPAYVPPGQTPKGPFAQFPG